MSEQNRRYVQKEIGRLLSDIWRIKGLAEQGMARSTSSPKNSQACMGMHNCCCRRLLANSCENCNVAQRIFFQHLFHQPSISLPWNRPLPSSESFLYRQLPYIVIGKGRSIFSSYITDFCLPPSYSKIRQVIGLNKESEKINYNAQADRLYLRQGSRRLATGPRWFSIARDFGLTGYVQNLDDGRVKVVAEGQDYDLGSLLAAIDIKNTLIQVADIQKEYSAAANEFRDFRIGLGQLERPIRGSIKQRNCSRS